MVPVTFMGQILSQKYVEEPIWWVMTEEYLKLDFEERKVLENLKKTKKIPKFDEYSDREEDPAAFFDLEKRKINQKVKEKNARSSRNKALEKVEKCGKKFKRRKKKKVKTVNLKGKNRKIDVGK